MDEARFVGEATILQAPVINSPVHSPFGQLPLVNNDFSDCNDAYVMIRPEQFVIDHPTNQIQGKVVRTVFAGHDAIVCLKMDDTLALDHTIHVRVSGSPQFTPGDTVGLKIDGEVMAYTPQMA